MVSGVQRLTTSLPCMLISQGNPGFTFQQLAHCLLTPYWAERLGKTRLEARQISARGGALTCELQGARVRIEGRVALYLDGEITL